MEIANLFFILSVTFGFTVADKFEDKPYVVFLDADLIPVATAPQVLGSFPHQCVGNIHECPDGFTVSLNYRPSPLDNTAPSTNILSSGGESPHSSGFYFRRNYGCEFEIGVALEEELWTGLFFLVDDSDTTITFTWNRQLTIYVDGVIALTADAPHKRLFTQPAFDVFTDITVGRSHSDVNDETVNSNLAMVNITAGVVAEEHIKSAVPDAILAIGCAVDIPGDVLSQMQVTNGENIETYCRSSCGEKDFNLAIVQGTSCYCGTREQRTGITFEEECNADMYHIFWVSHLIRDLPIDCTIEITVEVTKPSSKPYIRPLETVTFAIITSGPEVTLFIDFDDGTQKELMGRNVHVGHLWTKEGNYDVNVTAVSRTLTESTHVNVEIEYVEEGQPPSQVILKTDTVTNVPDVGRVHIFMDAFSLEMKCNLQTSSNEMQPFNDISDMIFSHDQLKTYPGIGLVNISFTCFNDFGSSGDWQLAVAANPELQFEHLPNPSGIEIPVMGSNHPGSNIHLYIDNLDKTQMIKKTDSSILIEENTVRQSGEHLVTIMDKDQTLLTKIFNMQQVIENVYIDVNILHTQVNSEVQFNFSIGQGDFMHVLLEYGDGTQETLFVAVPMEPVILYRNHSYSTLAKFLVKMHVVNDVSAQSSEKMISVERPISSVEMTSNNVTELGNPTSFEFSIDMSILPAMPVFVTFNYGNGLNESVMLGSIKSTPELLVHNYEYPEYGIYRVEAFVSNNISSTVVSSIVQVGENITYVDVYVDTDKAAVGDTLTFTVKCPRGYPLYIDLEMGDGEVIKNTRGLKNVPSSVEHETFSDHKRKRRSASIDTATTEKPIETTSRFEHDGFDEMSMMNFTSPVGQITENWPTPTPEPNEDFIFTYQYQTAGVYSVKVTVYNMYSTTESYLCPEIIIADANVKSPTCADFEVSIVEPTTENEPLVKKRSDEIRIPTTNEINCENEWKELYMPRYTWKTEWKTTYNTWRPELEVCHPEIMADELIIPTNTLWYGTYKLTVTMTLRGLELLSRKRRSITNHTIDLTTTGMLPTEYYAVETTTIDMVEISTQQSKEVSFEQLANALREEERESIVTELLKSQATTLTSMPQTTYLKIVPSPLVADIVDWDSESVTNFVKTDVIKANLSFAHDPDVDMANKTGLTMHLFCYVGKSETKYTGVPLDDLVDASVMFATNIARDVFVYQTDGCYKSLNGTLVFGHEVNIVGADLNMDDDLVFDLIITKDTRAGRAVRKAHVYSTTISADALDSIDWDNIDVNAALTIVSLVVGNGEGASETMTKVVNVMDKVAAKIENIDQLDKTTSVMGTVTGSGSLTKNAKATAASALGSTANKAKEVGESASLGLMENIGGTMVNGIGNVLPFPEPEEEEDDPPPVSTTPIPRITTVRPDVSTTTLKPMTPSSTPIQVGDTTTLPDLTTTRAVPQHGQRPSTSRAGLQFGGLQWDTLTTAEPFVGCINYTKAEKKEIQKKIVESRPAPPVGKCSIPTVAGLKKNEACDPDFDEDCGENKTWSFCCDDGCEVCNAEPKCCEMQEGLCAWAGWIEDQTAGDCDFWANVECNAMHPDDMEWLRKRFDEDRLKKKMEDFSTRKKTTTSGMKACSDISNVIMKKQNGDANTNLASPKMNLTIGKTKGNLGGAAGASESSSMSMESDNPFTYSDSADQVKTKVQTLELVDSAGKPISVENTTEPMYIWLDGQPDKVPLSNHTLLTTETVDWEYHVTKLAFNHSCLQAIITPFSNDDSYFVAIKFEDYPNDTYYDWMGTIPVDEHKLEPLSSWPEEIRDIPGIWDTMRHTAFPDPALTNRSGKYHIGIKLKGRMVDYTNPTNVSEYSLSLVQSGCRFFNTTTDTWESGGMTIGNYTTIYKTQCLSNHLTSFGGDFVVPPNTIDFKTVFSLEKFLESMPVFLTVTFVLLIYIGVVIWARHQDKKDLIKWGAAPLEDNLPTDNYHYQLTVCTGMKKSSNTKSRVSFIMSGDVCDTGVRRMYDGKRKELPAGSIYNFVLSTERCLGPLTFLRIWHDNSGQGKTRSWHLGQVQVVDLQTGEKFFFLCNRWLAVEEDDGAVERILPVAGMNDLTAFNHLFSSSVRKKLTNDHLWFSVVSRPTKSSFTRVQRVSCCVSLLFLTMITNCMFFKSDENVEKVSAVSIGPFSFTLHQLFISVVTTAIVFPPNLFIVTVFRKARAKKNMIMQRNQQPPKKSKKFQWKSFNPGSSLWNNTEKSKSQKFKESIKGIMTFHQKSKYEPEMDYKQKKKKSKALPYWTLYIAWTVCILGIVASGFFTILYSMEWGREKSLDWLSTFLLSFFQSVAVVQPIKVLLLAAFISCVLRKPELDEEEEDVDDVNTDSDPMLNAERDIGEIMKQRKMGASDIAPPDFETLEKARELRMKEMAMEAVLKECIVYIFFVMVLFFLSYQARDSDSYNFAQNIKNTVFPSMFGSITKPQDYWKFIGAFLPSLYSASWYNGRPLTWREALQIDDRGTIRVGVARLRTQRIKDNSCSVLKPFGTLIHHCRDAYSWTDDDTKNYMPGWELPPEGNETMVFDDLKSSWVYRDSIELKNPPYFGTLTTYKGGGYTLDFARSKTITDILLKDLEQHGWVDVNTRVVFLEFTLYNANVNLFGSVIMTVEFMSTGSAVTRSEVKVFRLSSYVGGFGIIVICFEVTFLCFTLYFLIKLVKDLRKLRLKYFMDFWNLLDFATLIFSIVSIAMYAMKKVFSAVAMNTLHESCSGEFVNFVSISIWDETFTMILAVVVFIATIKFIKMLKFNKRMGMLGDTVKLATKDLKYFSITFFIYFFAFCMVAYVIFGKTLPNYGSFIGAIESLFAFALGSFDFYELQSVDAVLGPIFFFLYVAIVNIGLMGMFLTIIADAFTQVKANAELQSNEHEVVDFIWGKFKGVFGWG